METSFAALKARLFSDERGNVAIPFALMSFIMFGTIAVATDVGRTVHAEAQLQSALDAAAIAALRVEYGRRVDVGTKVFNINMEGARATALTPEINTLGNGSVQARSTVQVETISGKLFGLPYLEVHGNAVADPKRTEMINGVETLVEVPGEVPCIHVMNQSEQSTFLIDHNEQLDASTCHAYVRSNRSRALTAAGNTGVEFKQIHVKGYADVQDGGLTIVDEPHSVHENAPVVGDPYLRNVDSVRKVLLSPKSTDCKAQNTNRIMTGAVPEGIYCGKTEFRDAILSGVYYILSKGSNTGELKLAHSVLGEGVTFYLVDNTATIKADNLGDGSVLKAPTTGATRGILIMEASNRGINQTEEISDVVIGSAKQHSWQGLIYLPSKRVSFEKFESFPMFNVAIASHTLTLKDWRNMTWVRQEWIPFTTDEAVRYDPYLMQTTTSSQVERPIWLSK